MLPEVALMFAVKNLSDTVSHSTVFHSQYGLQGPQLVIMVPTRELGVQIVMLIYKLFGGAVNSQIPGDAANMFTYTGPRGLKASLPPPIPPPPSFVNSVTHSCIHRSLSATASCSSQSVAESVCCEPSLQY